MDRRLSPMGGREVAAAGQIDRDELKKSTAGIRRGVQAVFGLGSGAATRVCAATRAMHATAMISIATT